MSGTLSLDAVPTLQITALLTPWYKGDPGDAATIEVGAVTTLAAGEPATVVNVGDESAAVLDFGIPAGEDGEDGDDGAAATIAVGVVSTVAPGAPATVANSGTVNAAMLDFGIPQGDEGDPGEAATIEVGSVTTVAPGDPATVVNSGSSSAAVFDFELPQGDTGDPGAAATIAVGNVVTVAAGDPATVTNSGSSSAAVFDFEIPEGAAGTPVELQADGIELEWRYVGAGAWTPLFDFGDVPPPYIERVADWTLALTDRNVDQWVNSGSARVCTVPLNATVAFDVGTKIPLLRQGSGSVTIDAVAGVTLNGVDGGSCTIQTQWQGALLVKLSTNGWAVSGDVSAVA